MVKVFGAGSVMDCGTGYVRHRAGDTQGLFFDRLPLHEIAKALAPRHETPPRRISDDEWEVDLPDKQDLALVLTPALDHSSIARISLKETSALPIVVSAPTSVPENRDEGFRPSCNSMHIDSQESTTATDPAKTVITLYCGRPVPPDKPVRPDPSCTFRSLLMKYDDQSGRLVCELLPLGCRIRFQGPVGELNVESEIKGIIHTAKAHKEISMGGPIPLFRPAEAIKLVKWVFMHRKQLEKRTNARMDKEFPLWLQKIRVGAEVASRAQEQAVTS